MGKQAAQGDGNVYQAAKNIYFLNEMEKKSVSLVVDFAIDNMRIITRRTFSACIYALCLALSGFGCCLLYVINRTVVTPLLITIVVMTYCTLMITYNIVIVVKAHIYLGIARQYISMRGTNTDELMTRIVHSGGQDHVAFKNIFGFD